MAEDTASRREFIKAVGAGALATGLGRAHAAQKTLKILQWVHFVPAYDEWFNERYVKEWGEKNDTDVIVDNIHNVGIPARAEAEVSAQKGHDLFLFNWPPPAFEEQVVDMRDVYQESERRVGSPIDLATKSTYNPKTKKYFAFSPSFTPDPVNWREDCCPKARRHGTRPGVPARRSGSSSARRWGSVSPRNWTHRWPCGPSCILGERTSRTRREIRYSTRGRPSTSSNS
jgi:hypothetical protein